MSGQDRRVSAENEVFTDRGNQEPAPRGERRPAPPAKAQPGDDVDETLAGGLQYPDARPEERKP